MAAMSDAPVRSPVGETKDSVRRMIKPFVTDSVTKGRKTCRVYLPTIAELPPPPPDKVGWPYTTETLQLPVVQPDGSLWPKISIVTPSYNQGPFIEETIRSVLLQGYPNLEFIIIDGGSTDETLSVIKKYERWIAYWVSETDRGQSHAINKGFALSGGSILGWINSDDYYCEGAFQAVASFFKDQSNTIGLGYGNLVDQSGRLTLERKVDVVDRDTILDWRKNWFIQPACFWPRSCWEMVGSYVDEDLDLLMDFDLWLRFLENFKFGFIDQKLACSRYYPACKSYSVWQKPRAFAEYAVLHAKYNQVNKAIEHINELYEAAVENLSAKPNQRQGMVKLLRLAARSFFKNNFRKSQWSDSGD